MINRQFRAKAKEKIALIGQMAQRHLHPACRNSSSLLWQTNSVDALSLVRVIPNTQYCGDESKEEQNRVDSCRGAEI